MANVTFSLTDVLEDVAGQSKPAVGGARVGQRISVNGDIPRNLIGDRAGIARVLTDLIELGSKCSESGDVVADIEVVGKGSDPVRPSVMLRTALRGSGAGLTCEEAANILMTFLFGKSRAGDGEKRRSDFAGRELLDRMGAGIAVVCEPAKGFVVSFTAAFRIELPATAIPKRKANRPGPREPKPGITMPDGLDRLRGAHILLAEDHPVNQNLTREILGQAGCSVEVAADGQATVSAVRDRGDSYDAVLMDVQMPIMDGFEATRRIRNELGRSDLPIIAMTANVLGDERQRCLAAGMDDYVPKPIHIPNIYAALMRWVKPHHPDPGGDGAAGPPVDRGTVPANSGTFVLPDRIPAIDIESGLSRTMGNRALYAGLLAQFVKSNESLGADVAAAIAEGDRDHARFLVHGLASTAGNLGAETLYSAACELEKALVKGSRNIAELLVAFENQLDRALSGIRDSGISVDGGPVRLGDGEGPFDREEASRAAEWLAAMLEDQDMAAHSQVDRLLEIFGGRGQDEQLRCLKARLDALEFPEAKRILAGICEELLN